MKPDLLQDLMLLSRAAQVVLQDEVMDAAEGTITPSRANVLRLLGRQGEQSVSSIAAFLGQTKANASLAVEAMVQAGFVRRDPDPRDRRGVRVAILPKGRRWLRRAEARQRELIEGALGHLSREEAERLSAGARTAAMRLLAQSRVSAESCLQCCAYESAACALGRDGWRCSFLGKVERERAAGAPAPARKERRRPPAGRLTAGAR